MNNTELPAFSVLMSTYKDESPRYLQEALDSIFNQTLMPQEVVLVEDGPLTRELYEVVRYYSAKYPCLKTVTLARNKGLGAALALGMQHCTNDLIARMDTDDISLPNRFEEQVKYMHAHPKTAVLSAWITEFDTTTGADIALKKLPEGDWDIKEYAKHRNPINHPASIMRKQAVIQAGGYQPFTMFEDYFLWVRMMLSGAHFHNLPVPLLRFRISNAMYSRRGGLKYLKAELRLQRYMLSVGFITLGQMLRNLSTRLIVRALPTRLRALLYIKFIR